MVVDDSNYDFFKYTGASWLLDCKPSDGLAAILPWQLRGEELTIRRWGRRLLEERVLERNYDSSYRGRRPVRLIEGKPSA